MTSSNSLIRTKEFVSTALASAAFFLILCSYYILRPVRDEMAVQYGADKLHWLFTGTFVATLCVVPIFGWAVKRIARPRLLAVVYAFLLSNLLLFWLLFSGKALTPTLAAGFFIWLSVFNLFAVSLFWSHVSDTFSEAQARRYYGYISAGGTAGALAGPAATLLLAKQVDTASLIGLSAILLALATVCLVVLRQRASDDTQAASLPVGGPLLAGITLTLKSPILRGIALLVICYTAVSTALYVGMTDLAGKTFASAGERKAFFASIDLAVNALSLALQLLGTRYIVQRFGLRAALCLSPLIMLAGLGTLAFGGTITGFAIVQVVHRAGEYAASRPGREMIYTTVDAESRYKGKNFIDTAVYRANDAASAWLFAAVKAAGFNAIAFVAIPAAIAWLWAGLKLGLRHDRPAGRHQHEST